MISKSNKELNTNRFKIPKEYFDTITIDNIKKTEKRGFKVPPNYFKTIDIRLINNTNYLNKIFSLKFKKLALSGVAAIFIIGLFINTFFSDPNSLNDDEIIEYMNYELVNFSSSDYVDLFDVNELQINFEQINELDLEYYIETSFSSDLIINND